MHRSFLVFGMAFIALMAGALFYAARLPMEAQSPAPAPAEAAPARAASVGARIIPAFSMPDLDGQERSLTDWSGQHRLLNFWATWCAPCRREIPLLKSFQTEQGGNGIQVIGIAVDFTEEVLAYAEHAQFNYPVVIGQEDAMELAEMSGIDFVGMPFTMVVEADGELLSAHIGEIHAPDLEHIDDVLRQLSAGEIDKTAARAALNAL